MRVLLYWTNLIRPIIFIIYFIFFIITPINAEIISLSDIYDINKEKTRLSNYYQARSNTIKKACTYLKNLRNEKYPLLMSDYLAISNAVSDYHRIEVDLNSSTIVSKVNINTDVLLEIKRGKSNKDLSLIEELHLKNDLESIKEKLKTEFKEFYLKNNEDKFILIKNITKIIASIIKKDAVTTRELLEETFEVAEYPQAISFLKKLKELSIKYPEEIEYNISYYISNFSDILVNCYIFQFKNFILTKNYIQYKNLLDNAYQALNYHKNIYVYDAILDAILGDKLDDCEIIYGKLYNSSDLLKKYIPCCLSGWTGIGSYLTLFISDNDNKVIVLQVYPGCITYPERITYNYEETPLKVKIWVNKQEYYNYNTDFPKTEEEILSGSHNWRGPLQLIKLVEISDIF